MGEAVLQTVRTSHPPWVHIVFTGQYSRGHMPVYPFLVYFYSVFAGTEIQAKSICYPKSKAPDKSACSGMDEAVEQVSKRSIHHKQLFSDFWWFVALVSWGVFCCF